MAFALRAEEPRPNYAVSVYNLGVTGGAIEVDAFAALLSSGGWCTAAATPQGARWNKRPASVPATEWLSVVVTGFGNQAHAFVFIFDGPKDSPRLLAHLPYGMTWLPSNVKKWIPPAGALAQSVRSTLQKPLLPATLAVNVKISEWQNAAAREVEPTHSTASVSNRDGFPPMEVMFCAALCKQGFSPTWEAAEQSMRLELRFEVKSAAMRATSQSKNTNLAKQKDAISEDHYYAFLTRLLYMLKADASVADFALPGGAQFRVLTATPDRVCGVGENGLFACDPRNGKRLWPANKPAHANSYAAQRDNTEAVHIFRYSGGVAAVAQATGNEKVLSPEVPSFPWSYTARADGTAVVAKSTALIAHRAGAQLWRNDESSAITAGPALSGNLLFAGNTEGDFFCKNADDGAEKWRINFVSEWRGPVGCTDEFAMAFLKGEDALVALNVKDGSQAWKQPLGDVLLKTPQRLGKQWLVTGKNNRIVLLNSADGKVEAEVRWATWLADVLAITIDGKTLIVCSDIRGRISVLDAGLKITREVMLPARPAGELVFAANFPGAWATAQTEGDIDALLALDNADTKASPAVLVTDQDGFCYIIQMK